MPNIPVLDLSALVWFLCCWIGYTTFADRRARGRWTLMSAMHEYRRLWMREMMKRDIRIFDSNIVGTLARSVTFFASRWFVGGVRGN